MHINDITLMYAIASICCPISKLSLNKRVEVQHTAFTVHSTVLSSYTCGQGYDTQLTASLGL